ncbi:hypothetical protein Bca101_065676 [Brassica carinata]
MGISQSRTRGKLEADRRRHDEKRLSRSDNSYQSVRDHHTGPWQRPYHGRSTSSLEWKEDKNFRFTYGARKAPQYQSGSNKDSEPPARRASAKERLSFGKESNSESQGQTGSQYNRSTSRNEWRPIQTNSQTGTNSRTSPAQVSHTPSPKPPREGTSLHTPVSNQSLNGGSLLSSERRSALDRLSLPKERTPPTRRVPNAESGRLQDVDIQYLEENLTVHLSGGSNVPSSSRHQERETPNPYDPAQDRSPIRTLS